LIIKCNACDSEVIEINNFGNQPIVNHLQKEKLNCDTYALKFGVCTKCSLGQLIDPIESRFFYTDYMTPSSNKPNPHINSLLKIISKYIQFDSKIFEVGANDGTFMDILQNYGFEQVSGIEPTKNTSRTAIKKGLNILNDFFTYNLATKSLQKEFFDLVISRQVLEHITNLKDFGMGLHHIIKDDGLLIIEVPDSEQIISNSDYGSLWEEHVNYFTIDTLTNYLNSIGFSIIKAHRSLFSGICLTVVAKKIRPENIKENNPELEIIQWKNWASNFLEFKSRVKKQVEILSNNKKIVLYGVGARSSMTVNLLGLSPMLYFAIDDLAEKQNHFMPKNLTEIISLDEAINRSLGEDLFILLGVNA
jgi:2-polyprenyl-3-methyl-5-hydroxy-6-metoxy-1,4-benzoquinol methylase